MLFLQGSSRNVTNTMGMPPNSGCLIGKLMRNHLGVPVLQTHPEWMMVPGRQSYKLYPYTRFTFFLFAEFRTCICGKGHIIVFCSRLWLMPFPSIRLDSASSIHKLLLMSAQMQDWDGLGPLTFGFYHFRYLFESNEITISRWLKPSPNGRLIIGFPTLDETVTSISILCILCWYLLFSFQSKKKEWILAKASKPEIPIRIMQSNPKSWMP